MAGPYLMDLTGGPETERIDIPLGESRRRVEQDVPHRRHTARSDGITGIYELSYGYRGVLAALNRPL
jgi:hypothetical protein